MNHGGPDGGQPRAQRPFVYNLDNMKKLFQVVYVRIHKYQKALLTQNANAVREAAEGKRERTHRRVQKNRWLHPKGGTGDGAEYGSCAAGRATGTCAGCCPRPKCGGLAEPWCVCCWRREPKLSTSSKSAVGRANFYRFSPERAPKPHQVIQNTEQTVGTTHEQLQTLAATCIAKPSTSSAGFASNSSSPSTSSEAP
jgi:hypothetical protein